MAWTAATAATLAATAPAARLDLGDWAEYRAVTQAGARTVEVTQRYAIVGEERQADGNRWVWLEIAIGMPGTRMVQKVLLPAAALAAKGPDSWESFRDARRWIVRSGDEPAVEMPIAEALAQMRNQTALAEDPEATAKDLAPESIATPRGTLRCTRRESRGVTKAEQLQGNSRVAVSNAYTSTVWRHDTVPITRLVRTVAEATVEVTPAGAAADTRPSRQQTRTTIDLVNFGTGATTAILDLP
jgi:hypothetical protein